MLTTIRICIKLDGMYICLCNGVTERDLALAMEQGRTSVRDLHRATGCGSQCGRCLPAVQAFVESRSAALSAAEFPKAVWPTAGIGT